MDIGSSIKILRQKRKISQQVLAARLHVTQGFLSLMEKNKREPTLEMIAKLSKALAVPKELILLLACNDSPKSKKFKKPLQSISKAIADMLMGVNE